MKFIRYLLLYIGISYGLHNSDKINLTPKQNKYSDFIHSNKYDLIIATGPAGTGKTWIACKKSLEHLHNGDIQKIVITRPTTTVENENIGFLPGNTEEKFSPFSQPLFDCFQKDISKKDIEMLIKNDKIEICPLGFMRGRTFDNAVIIADEMQNSLPSQMKMLLTRVGHNTKLIITGDISQCDLDIEKNTDGLSQLLQKLELAFPDYHDMIKNAIATIQFNIEDSKRSDFVRKILSIYSD
jgi:phosphate starvation-inducible PhoH-like protein